MRHEKLTKGEIAERFGVDVRTITNWVALGMPQRRESGKPTYAWPECRAWREEQIRNDARAMRHGDTDTERKTKAAEFRLRQLEIDTENAELDLAERRGELVPLDFMRTEFNRIALAIRNRLLSLPQAWAVRLGSTQTTIDRQVMLQDAINELMPILSELADAEDDTDPAGEDDTDVEVETIETAPAAESA